jgi:hypothetical protein
MQCILCDQALSGMPGHSLTGGATEMQITRYALSAFAWMAQCMVHDEAFGSVQY